MTPKELIEKLEPYKNSINDIIFVNDYTYINECDIKYDNGIVWFKFDFPVDEPVSPDRFSYND